MITRVLVSAIALALAFFTSTAAAQDVRYEKYKLDNGMTVILHEDHALPIVAINTWYRVGAKDEQRGRSGFAHLFEHLMFMGTERVPGNAFDVIMETGGGANNASTSLDRTNYYSWGPAELLPTLLWLDADRLEDLGRTMTKEKLDLQRDVVRNELRQQVENRPYGKAEEHLYRLMYPLGHPYHEAVYGTHEDLEAANVNNVKDFFANFYVPNNASLVVAGDFRSAEIKPLIASLFGSLPRGGEPDRRPAVKWPEPKLERVVRLTMLDKVELPKVGFVYHSPPQYAEGDAEMDLLAAVLADGKSSRLYRRLVLEDQTAVDVSALQNSATLGSMFQIEVMTKPDADLAKVERAVDEEIARLLDKGILTEELDQRKATTELAMLGRVQSLLNKADQLNAYEYAFGEPNSFKRDLDRYRNATAQSVTSWAKRVLTPDARAIVRVTPEAPEREPNSSGRDKQPEIATAPAFAPGSPESFTLSNGVQVMLWYKPELPLVAVKVLLHPGGPLVENSKAGAAALAAEMLTEGTGDMDGVKFAQAMESLGARFGAGADTEVASVDFTVLKRNLQKAAGLMGQAIRSPRMDKSDFDRVHALHLDQLRQAEEEPAIVATNVGSRALFGDGHPYAVPSEGTLKTAEALTLADVQAAHASVFNAANATVLISGDVTGDEARPALEKAFGGWSAGTKREKRATPTATPGSKSLRLFVVDRPGAVQTVIRYMMPGPTLTTSDRARLRVLNTLFGGSFTSRLNQNLREKHGYTYGARSHFVMEPSAGYFTAAASVRSEVTGASIKEFMDEFKRIRGGDISDDEAAKARRTYRTDVIQDFEGVGGVLNAAAELIAAGIPLDTIAKDLAAAGETGAADLNKLVQAGPGGDVMPLTQGVLVLVGDKKLILEQIKDLGLGEPVELTAAGERVK